MVTIVLTTIGSAIGGPVGGVIGAVIGNAIDRDVIFRPKGRQGPRLTELALQTSSYGTPIARVFGTMRIGGCVIWATDLIESRATSRSGKGQPSTTNYSYAASFAVALSARPISGVGRIWADGKLLRGAGGDFKSMTGFRLHLGDEDQAVDPLIASAEGIDETPAHRGIAYVVFDQFQLADYGNRIPSLTFEVIADDGGVAPGAIAAELSDGAIVDGGAGETSVDGFAAYGDSVRAVIDTLSVIDGARFVPEGGRLRRRQDRVADRVIDDTGASSDARPASRGGRMVAPLETIPQRLSIAHYDPARDYQIGLQQARRAGPGARADRIELPVAIDAARAKQVAEEALARAEAGRERRTITLPWRAIDILPGAAVTIADVSGVWRVAGWALEHMVLSLECVRLPGRGASMTAASPGRVASAPDTETGTSVIELFEMLPLDDVLLGSPRLSVVAAGSAPGWRRAALLYSSDGGAHWTSAGATAAPGIIGRVVAMSPTGPVAAAILDVATVIDVDLIHDGMALAGTEEGAMRAGANLALVGDELLQFERAEQIGPLRWRLSRLARGRRGTEAAAGTQAAGDRFVLIENDAMIAIDLPLAAPGQEIRVMASGTGDLAAPAMMSATISGASIVPPSPVHLSVIEQDNGDAALQWVRRSRNGWNWIDGVDAPLGEEALSFRVQVTAPDGTSRRIETVSADCIVSAADRAAGVRIEVRQIGARGESPAAVATLPPL